MMSNNRIYYLVCFFICFLKMHICFAQWNIVAEKEIGRNELYSIQNERAVQSVPFFFPEINYNDSTNLVGYKLFEREQLQWSKKIENSFTLNIDSVCLFLKFYSENVNSIFIEFANDIGEKYIGELHVNNELYHVPIHTNLGLWESNINDTIKQLKDYPTPVFTVNSLTVSITKKNNLEPHKLIFTDFSLYMPIVSKSKVLHPFFDKLTKTSALNELEYNLFSRLKGEPIVLNTFDNYSLIPVGTGNFQINFDTTLTEKTALQQFSSLLVEKYPFYQERNIDKQLMINKIDDLFSTENSIHSLIDGLRTIIAQFHDPHFYLQEKQKNIIAEIKVAGPVALHQFYNHVYVASVFDSILIKTLPPGTRILEVDRIEIGHLIDSLSNNYKGSLVSRRNKALARLLYRNKDEKALLKAVYEKDTIDAVIFYDKKNIIPPNFKPINREYRILNEQIAYFRLNNWFLGDWLSFYNHLDDLKKRKGLIIDLRNNGGGYSLEGMRIASCFIRQPAVYSHSFFSWNEESSIKETLMIKPNYNVDLTHVKVIILGNERTACASEIFIDFMQRNAGAVFIGTNNTAGAYANLYSANILDEVFYFNSMVKSLTADQKCIENIGIQPDIYVTVSKVKDLYPYNDKVLQTGIHLLLNNPFLSN